MLFSKHSVKLLIFIVLSLSSCKVEELIQSNNTIAEDQTKLLEENNNIAVDVSTKIDSLRYEAQAIQKLITATTENNLPPNLGSLKRVSFDEFYFGVIVKEEVLERQGSWLNIELTEKIQLETGGVILRNRQGWYSYNSPNYIYTGGEVVTLNKENKAEVLNQVESKTKISKFVVTISGTTKSDLLNQKEVDLLLSQSDLNFDGLVFNDKKFDFSNFNLGSYRGTKFLKCNLSNVTAIRPSIGTQTDFEYTTISEGVTENMTFQNWKFIQSIFFKTTLNNIIFNDCILTGGSGVVTFNQAKLFGARFTNSQQGYFKEIAQNQTEHVSSRFENVKFYQCVSWGNIYQNCSFFDCEWRGSAMLPYGGIKGKILGGFFKNLVIYSGDYSDIQILKNGLSYPEFTDLNITFSKFRNAVIDAWFKTSLTIIAPGGDYSYIDFKTSIFEAGIFGNSNMNTNMNMQNCDFSKCDFRGNVTFTKCDLRGATFPSDLSRITFIDCIGRP